MKITERQIVAALDHLHRALAGSQPCRWTYQGMQDKYTCPHLGFTGREVISQVESVNHYTGGRNGTTDI